MHRRTVLTGFAALTTALAGCGGSSDDPGRRGTPQSLHVPEFTFEEGSEGNSVVVLTVANRGEKRREATMTTKIRVQDEELVSGEADVSVPAGSEETYRVEFDVAWSWFDENRNLQGVEFE